MRGGGGGSKAVLNFSENSSVLVAWPVPKDVFSAPLIHPIGCLVNREEKLGNWNNLISFEIIEYNLTIRLEARDLRTNYWYQRLLLLYWTMRQFFKVPNRSCLQLNKWQCCWDITRIANSVSGPNSLWGQNDKLVNWDYQNHCHKLWYWHSQSITIQLISFKILDQRQN